MEGRPLPQGQGAEEEVVAEMDQKQRFIQFLQIEIQEWEDEARNAEKCVQHVVGEEQKQDMAATGQRHRDRAKRLKDFIELEKLD